LKFVSLAAFGSYLMVISRTAWRLILLVPLGLESFWVFGLFLLRTYDQQIEDTDHHEHRRERLPGRRPRCRDAHQECRHRNVPGEGERAAGLPILQAGDERPGAHHGAEGWIENQQRSRERLVRAQHLIGNLSITVDGDTASDLADAANQLCSFSGGDDAAGIEQIEKVGTLQTMIVSREERKALIHTTKSKWLQTLSSMDHEDDDPGTTWNGDARKRDADRMSPRQAWRAIQAARNLKVTWSTPA
jgi:hypothetical protein